VSVVLPGGVAGRIEESFTLRRLRRRVGLGPPIRRSRPPRQPIGVKLELTHRCNLRCDFCYTDSPRRTVERAADLDDDSWRRIVEQAIELGVIEAVVTGGEPLLRKDLVLELLERLDSAGVGVALSTNGWFVDESVADRLSRLTSLIANVSVDGATPELHDAARGVPGSWRRAVRAIDLLLDRGIDVSVTHVATPLNVRHLDALVEHMWLLGAPTVRVTPVVPVGAASRASGWGVDRRRLRRIAAAACRRGGDDFTVAVQSGTGEVIVSRQERAPAALLVRPNGDVLVDSLHPFSFGTAHDGLDECWARIVSGWQDPAISDWARGIAGSRQLAQATVVPYADEDVRLGAGRPSARSRDGRPRLPRRTASSTQAAASAGDVAAARAHVSALALGRRYRVASLRWGGGEGGERLVRLRDSGRVYRLNRSAGMVLDHLRDSPAREASAALAARHPEAPRERVERDTIGLVRWLRAHDLVRPAGAPAG
jgi:MoaA/NifB/PqqE/SkfB family radical SAM enzyme